MVEIGVAIESAIFYDCIDALGILDVVERVSVQEDEVGELARFDYPKIGSTMEGYGWVEGGGLQGFQGRKAGTNKN